MSTSDKPNYGWCVLIDHSCDTDELCEECHYLTDEQKEWVKKCLICPNIAFTPGELRELKNGVGGINYER